MANDSNYLNNEFGDANAPAEYSTTTIVERRTPSFPKTTPPRPQHADTSAARRAEKVKARPERAVTIAPPKPDAAALAQCIIGSSPKIAAVREKILHYAPEESPVCILGESGVGKELVAEQIHAFSRRNNEVFLPLNAGAIPETLATAELFGHQKGSFTGAHVAREGAFLEANHGTLYLDEIGEMPPSIQAQLLRVLDDGKVMRIGSRMAERSDVRLVTATNVDLKKNIREGVFRRDLYYRICVLPIHVPPLRDRGDDVIEIAEHMIRRHDNPDYRKATLTPRAVERLLAYRFSGNVRELRNLMDRAVINARGHKITPDDLEFDAEIEAVGGGALAVGEARDLAEKLVACIALARTDGNVKRAAEIAGVTRSSFYKIKNQLDGKDYAAQVAAMRSQLQALFDA